VSCCILFCSNYVLSVDALYSASCQYCDISDKAIVISPYLSKKSSDFDEILYTAADFELDERHVIKNGNVALDRLRVRQNVFLVLKEISCENVGVAAETSSAGSIP